MEQETLQQVFSKVKDIKLRVDFLDSLTSEALRRKKDEFFKGEVLIYNELISLLNNVEYIVNVLEDEDPNLNMDSTNLEPVDKYFDGSPISNHIDINIKKAKERATKEELTDSDTKALFKKAEDTDNYYQEKKNKIMDDIEKHLDSKTDHLMFTNTDYGLIRFYLSNLAHSDQQEVQGLTDRGLELAWRRRKANKG